MSVHSIDSTSEYGVLYSDVAASLESENSRLNPERISGFAR